MSSRKFALTLARTAIPSFCWNYRFVTCYSLSSKPDIANCQATKQQPTKVSARFSTFCHMQDAKKVGLFLFGRPPKPNLDAGKPSTEVKIEDLDPISCEILVKLHQAEQPGDVLNVFQENKSFMTEIHTSRALQQLAEISWDLQSKDVPMVRSSQMSLARTEPIFRELCVSCLRDAQHMDDISFLVSLRSLLSIGVPENSALIHTLLSHSQYRVNQMTPSSLAIFCQIVQSLKIKTELTQALNEALILIIPKVIGKADSVWQLLDFLKMTGKHLRPITKGRLINQLLALLKLNPSITPHDCFAIILTFSYFKFQANDTLNEVYQHLHEGYEALSDFEICRLIKHLGWLRYRDVKLIGKLCDFVSRSFEELDSDSICNIFDGLTAGRFYHPELANLGCRYIVDSSSDLDLTVELSMLASVSRYLADYHLKPKDLTDFISHGYEACKQFFADQGPAEMRKIKWAIDASYYLCILNELRSPCTRKSFEERAGRFPQPQCEKHAQKICQQKAMLRHLDGIYQPHVIQPDQSMSNPWKERYGYDLGFEKELVLKVLEDLVGPGQFGVDVDLHGELQSEFLITSAGEKESELASKSAKGLAINILPRDGQAANRRGHLIGSVYLKDRCMKYLGYQTFWIEANEIAVKNSEGSKPLEDGLSHLKERLQQKL